MVRGKVSTLFTFSNMYTNQQKSRDYILAVNNSNHPENKNKSPIFP